MSLEVIVPPLSPQLGHDGATPESCWLVDELSVAVPTKGVKYIFACMCWLAKDRGDGLTARVFNVLDAEVICISQKVRKCHVMGVCLITAGSNYCHKVVITQFAFRGKKGPNIYPYNYKKIYKHRYVKVWGIRLLENFYVQTGAASFLSRSGVNFQMRLLPVSRAGCFSSQ